MPDKTEIMRYIPLVLLTLLTACESGSTNETDSSEPLSEETENVSEPDDTLKIGSHNFLLRETNEQPLFQGTLTDPLPEDELLYEDQEVIRSGDSLLFQLHNGHQFVLENQEFNEESDVADFASYTFQGSVPNSDYWLVYGIGYEWYWYVMVNKADGDTVITRGKPAISPDKQLMITINEDLSAGFTMNGFELYVLRNNSYALDGSLELDNWGPVSIKWLNNDQALVTQRKYTDSDYMSDFEHTSCTLTLLNDNLQTLKH